MKGTKVEEMKPPGRVKNVTFDYPNNTWTIVDKLDEGQVKFPDFGDASGIYHGEWGTNIWKIKVGDPLSAYNECNYVYHMGREEDNWEIKIDNSSKLTADKDNFYLVNHIKAYENEKLVFEKVFDDDIPRQFV
ncbi:unnamed protein product [Ambrosiozyma monospora]|uniref:Unnamed protein product n=1 Tax=Ambrosiozyma monospora TaxID=43982 RepID=A0ACB5T6B5_AMBMO|nr:unnamed protein product [Ambrosiozyma monospora]